jgi:YesN/AraC family two-component response regulator
MIINSQPGMLMVAQASTGREAIERFREHKPDVTLIDLRLPDMSGIDAIIAIRGEFPGARMVESMRSRPSTQMTIFPWIRTLRR